jgi:hypothetical protein
MTRLLGLLLASMLAVTPTVDMVCRAVCTPDTAAADAPSCHEVVSATADGALLPATSCQRDAAAAAPPTDGTRNAVTRAPLVTVQVTAFAHVSASVGADLRRQAVRPRTPQTYLSTVVLRI